MLRLSHSMLYVCCGAGFLGLFLTEIAISPVFAQAPTLQPPKVTPTNPAQPQRPANTQPVQIDTRVQARANTRRAPLFDIHLLKFSNFRLVKPKLRNSMLRADALTFDVTIVNSGDNTFAFAGNQIDTSIIEGFFDYRQRANVDRRGVRYYPARGLYDVVVRSDNSLALPLIIKGPRRNKVGLWPVPLPNRYGAGIRAVNLSSGQGRVYLKPEVWYTLSARLVPADADEVVKNHSMFVNVRFNNHGRIVEMKGPYPYG